MEKTDEWTRQRGRGEKNAACPPVRLFHFLIPSHLLDGSMRASPLQMHSIEGSTEDCAHTIMNYSQL